jgi:transposase
MLKVSWNEDERWPLEARVRGTPNRRLRNRCQAVLMAARGRRHRQIAEDLGSSVRTLQRWLNAYHTSGVEGRMIQWAAGRVPRLPAALAPVILEWMTQGPAGCGLDWANWTYAELAAYLYRTHGIAVSESTRRSFGRQHGVRSHRPTSRYLKADPAQQAAARAYRQYKAPLHAPTPADASPRQRRASPAGLTAGRAPQGCAPGARGLGLPLRRLGRIPGTNPSVHPARRTGPALIGGG